MNDAWFDSRQRQEIFLLCRASRQAPRPTQCALQWVPEVLYPGVKWPGHEADQSPRFSAGVNEWRYTSTPIYAWIACTGTALLYCVKYSTFLRQTLRPLVWGRYGNVGNQCPCLLRKMFMWSAEITGPNKAPWNTTLLYSRTIRDTVGIPRNWNVILIHTLTALHLG